MENNLTITEHRGDPAGHSWRVLVACYAGMMAMALSIQALSPVSHKILESLSLDYGRLGFMMGAISIPGIMLAIPGGQFADRWGSTRLLFFGFFSLIAGALFFIFSRSYFLLCTGRIVTGVGCALLSVVLPGILAFHYDRKRLGTAMGIFNTALPLGSIAALSLLGPLGVIIGWFNVFLVPAIAAFVAGLCAFLLLPRHEKTDLQQQREIQLPRPGPVWVLGAIVLFSNMATMGYVTISPSYYEIQGFPFTQIGLMLSAVLMGAFFLSPWAGYLSTLKGMARALLFWASLLMAAALVSIPILQTPLVLDLAMLAISSGLIMTPVYILVPQIVPESQVNTGYGVIMASMMLGCLAGPFIAGLCAHSYGLAAGFYFIGSSSLLAAGAVLLPGIEEPAG